MAELRQNTWSLDEWYDQHVAGNVEYNFSGNFGTVVTVGKVSGVLINP